MAAAGFLGGRQKAGGSYSESQGHKKWKAGSRSESQTHKKWKAGSRSESQAPGTSLEPEQARKPLRKPRPQCTESGKPEATAEIARPQKMESWGARKPAQQVDSRADGRTLMCLPVKVVPWRSPGERVSVHGGH